MRFTGIHTLRTSKGFKDSKYLVQSDWSLHPRSKMTKARKHNDCQKEDDEIAWFSVPCSKFVHYVYIYIYIMYIMHICILSIYFSKEIPNTKAMLLELSFHVSSSQLHGVALAKVAEMCMMILTDHNVFIQHAAACCSKKYMKNQIDSNCMYISV